MPIINFPLAFSFTWAEAISVSKCLHGGGRIRATILDNLIRDFSEDTPLGLVMATIEYNGDVQTLEVWVDGSTQKFTAIYTLTAPDQVRVELDFGNLAQ